MGGGEMLLTIGTTVEGHRFHVVFVGVWPVSPLSSCMKVCTTGLL